MIRIYLGNIFVAVWNKIYSMRGSTFPQKRSSSNLRKQFSRKNSVQSIKAQTPLPAYFPYVKKIEVDHKKNTYTEFVF